MRLRHLHTFLLLFATFYAIGQTVVTIPDAAFLSCLKSRYPSVINTSNQLDVGKAASLTGSLLCTKGQIQSAEGLQYFTSISYIDLNSNQLNFLPTLSNLQNLVHLDISTNHMTYLPDLSAIKGFKELYAQRNNIQWFDLSKNDSLTELYIHTNSIDSLFDMSRLKQLYLLNIVNNNIRTIPHLEQLTALKTLVCWGNQITSFPSFVSLPLLATLDASKNQLTSFPEFGPNNNLKTLFLNDNQLDSLPPSLSYLTGLTNAKFHNNRFTFEDLIKVKALNLNDTTFKVSPQATLQVGTKDTATEYKSLKLATGVDQGVPGVLYTWSKNGIAYTPSPKDSLIFPKVSLGDSGFYSCQITCAAFPTLTLQTDSFDVSVAPCIDIQNFSTAVTEINCTKSGALTLSANPLPPNVTYTLKSPMSGKTFTSQTGQFTGLLEPKYVLSFQTTTGCTKTYSKNIVLPFQECKDFLITPDNDGNMDTYYFSGTGTVKIFDKSGYPVKEMKIPGEWDCTSSNSGKVPIGYYIAYINEGETQIGLSVMY
jgi:Leucine-rich repeat (LRR) protein